MIRRTAMTRMLIGLTLLSVSGCRLNRPARYSCGESTTCGDPVIIFVGASRDVAKMGRVPQLSEKFRECGYNATYFDPWRSLRDVDEVCDLIRMHRRRGSRVMVVGWSIGTVVGLKALHRLQKEGVDVDTFVEVDCFNLKRYMGDHVHPCNAHRVVVIRSSLNQPVEGYYRPAVHRLDTAWHLGVPHHERTVCVLKSEANRIRTSSWRQATQF